MGLKNVLMPGIPGKTPFVPQSQDIKNVLAPGIPGKTSFTLGATGPGSGGGAPQAATMSATPNANDPSTWVPFDGAAGAMPAAAPGADHIWSMGSGWGENYNPPVDLSLPTGSGDNWQPGLTTPPQATGMGGDNYNPARPTFSAPTNNGLPPVNQPNWNPNAEGWQGVYVPDGKGGGGFQVPNSDAPAAAAPAPAPAPAPSPIGGGGQGWLDQIKGAKNKPPPPMQQPTPTAPVQRPQFAPQQPWTPPQMLAPKSNMGGMPPQQMTAPPPWAMQGGFGGQRPGMGGQRPGMGGGMPPGGPQGNQRMQMLMQMLRGRGPAMGAPGGAGPGGPPGAMPGQPGGV